MTDDSADLLIPAEGLAALLDAGEPVTLLDVRWQLAGPPGRELYLAGHVPGAVFVDLDRDLTSPPVPGGRGGRHPMPSPGGFEAAMRRAGVADGRPVVVYDDADSTAAARAWWLLRYFGHRSVRVLDGGFRAWAEAGHPVVSGAPGEPGTPGEPGAPEEPGTPGEPGAPEEPGTPGEPSAPGEPGTPGEPSTAAESGGPAAPGDFTASPGHLPLLDADAAATLARTGLLLDARAGERYRGETEPIDAVAGHIPGAVSAPTSENVTGAGAFRPAPELAERFAALGVVPGAEVGTYCGSGVTAAHQALALALLGVTAAVYVGSWSDWITDPTRPIATGKDPS